MKINRETMIKEIPYANLNAGKVFIFENMICLKTNMPDTAINLNNGECVYITGSDLVIYLDDDMYEFKIKV